MSTSASTTVSTVPPATARSRASTVSDAPATSPFGRAVAAFRACTSVIAHLQYQLASHSTLFQAPVCSLRFFEQKRFLHVHLQAVGLEHLGRRIQPVAVRFDQRLLNAHPAPLCRGFDRVVGAV